MDGIEAMGLRMHVAEGHRLWTLNTPRVPEGIDEAKVRQWLLDERGIEISGGQFDTIQDNCAHEGQSNPEHSWHSIKGWCEHSDEDPDEPGKAKKPAVARTIKAGGSMLLLMLQ